MFKDTALCPTTLSPIFDIGTRFLIYSSSSSPPPSRGSGGLGISLSGDDEEEDQMGVGERDEGGGTGEMMENLGRVAGKVCC